MYIDSYEDSCLVFRSSYSLLSPSITKGGVTGHKYTLFQLLKLFFYISLEALLRTRHPASLKSCVLLSKPSMHKVQVNIDYLGFTIPNIWVVGYGLDYANTHRTLPYIGVLKSEVYQDREDL